MRSEIMDASAIAFARDLYTAIASGHPLEAALTEARKGMMLETGRNCPEWSLPVLFIRTPDSLLVQPKAVVGDRRFLQFSLTTRLEIEKGTRPEAARDLRARLWQILGLLSPVQVGVEIKIEAHLGAKLNLIQPVNVAVAEPPVFAWSIGEEFARACQRIADALGTPSLLTARVGILDDLETVWESPVKLLEMSTPVDVSVEAERVHDLACPPEVYRRLDAERKYHWRLILTFGVPDRRGHLERRVVVQQAAFRVLSAQEKGSLSQMLSSLPNESAEDTESALLRGAIYESLGVYDKAIQAYEKALLDKHWHNQVYPRLANLYSKRAYELLGLPGEKPSSVPLAFFAQKANYYRSSAALHSAV